jgi:hypothetical protein
MSAPAPARELRVIPTNCRFYGKNGRFGKLVPTGGNQCGLITASHSPCVMEQNAQPIDETRCDIVVAVAQAIQRAEAKG